MSLKNDLKGSLVALVTPMTIDGSIDKDALAELIEWQIAANTKALIVAGTTGESAALQEHEHTELVTFTVKQVKGRIPVIAGTGTNSTLSTIKLSKNAEKAGADACLVVTPYYVRPTQNGLFEHYKAVAESLSIPLFLYNVPARTGCDLLPETAARLAQVKNIIGLKEASGKENRAAELSRICPADFPIFSGNDIETLEFMKHGARGVISVTANVAPEKMSQMCEALLNGNLKEAEKINNELLSLHKNLFLESNPIPTKWALQTMGKIKSGIRLPLLPLDSKYHDEVKEAMKNAGVHYREVVC